MHYCSIQSVGAVLSCNHDYDYDQLKAYPCYSPHTQFSPKSKAGWWVYKGRREELEGDYDDHLLSRSYWTAVTGSEVSDSMHSICSATIGSVYSVCFDCISKRELYFCSIYYCSSTLNITMVTATGSEQFTYIKLPRTWISGSISCSIQWMEKLIWMKGNQNRPHTVTLKSVNIRQ